jgi:hypothetical protein
VGEGYGANKDDIKIKRGIHFLYALFNTASSECRPSDSTVPEDAGIEPRTVATLALTARLSKHLAIDLIHTWLDLIKKKLALFQFNPCEA